MKCICCYQQEDARKLTLLWNICQSYPINITHHYLEHTTTHNYLEYTTTHNYLEYTTTHHYLLPQVYRIPQTCQSVHQRYLSIFCDSISAVFYLVSIHYHILLYSSQSILILFLYFKIDTITLSPHYLSFYFLLNFKYLDQIRRMKKKTSQSDELNISNYFYAVYPLSIEFKEDYQKVLYLQFEKNLQIVLKFQLNKEPASKNQIISFDLPQKITHFRILSQKNLQYQWSLYCHERVNEERHEQFMQSQKINYKNYWTDYQSRQVDIHIIYVEFKKIKCKLQYLFVIANNSNQLLLKIKKHYALNLKPYPQRSNLSKQSQKPQSAMNAQFQSKLSNITGVEVEQKGRQVDSSPPLIFDHPNHDAQLLKQSSSEVQLQSLRLGMGRPLQQSIYQKQSNKQPNDKDLLTPQKSQQFLKLEEEKRYLKLSRSEIELSNKMMEDFEGLQSSVQKKTPKHQKSQSPQQFFALKHTGEQTLELPAIREPATQNLEARKQEADIKMTSSTLLNEKGQAIIPFYKNKAYIMIIIMVLLILGTALALFFMPRAKAQPDSINKPKERKTKGKERMKQQMGEGKGKGKREMKVKKQGVAQQVGDVKQKKVQQKQRDVVKKMRSK